MTDPTHPVGDDPLVTLLADAAEATGLSLDPSDRDWRLLWMQMAAHQPLRDRLSAGAALLDARATLEPRGMGIEVTSTIPPRGPLFGGGWWSEVTHRPELSGLPKDVDLPVESGRDLPEAVARALAGVVPSEGHEWLPDGDARDCTCGWRHDGDARGSIKAQWRQHVAQQETSR